MQYVCTKAALPHAVAACAMVQGKAACTLANMAALWATNLFRLGVTGPATSWPGLALPTTPRLSGLVGGSPPCHAWPATITTGALGGAPAAMPLTYCIAGRRMGAAGLAVTGALAIVARVAAIALVGAAAWVAWGLRFAFAILFTYKVGCSIATTPLCRANVHLPTKSFLWHHKNNLLAKMV